MRHIQESTTFLTQVGIISQIIKRSQHETQRSTYVMGSINEEIDFLIIILSL